MNTENSGRATLVSVITTPLGFFALSLLIVEGFLGLVLLGSNLEAGQKFLGLMIGSALFILVVGAVVVLVWTKPQNLTFSEASHLAHEKFLGNKDDPLTAKELKDLPKAEEDLVATIGTVERGMEE